MQRKHTLATLFVVAVLFLAVNSLASLLLRARLDLTAEGLYSLSPGTQQILRELEEPIRLDFYQYLDEVEDDQPDLVNHARRVREFLEEVARHGGEEIQLRVLEPEPFSEAEDAARAAGVAAVPVGNRVMWLGLVARNSVDEEEVIPFFAPGPSREAFLEYEVARVVHSLAQVDKPRIGLLTSLPMQGSFDPSNPRAPQQPDWMILDQLRQVGEVVNVDASGTALPEDLDLLMVVHPKGLEQELLVAIDQFVLGGGRLLAFMDPSSREEAMAQQPSQFQPQPPPTTPSDLGPLLAAWGVDWNPEQVLLDRELALRVTVPSQRGYEPVDHPAFVEFGAEQLDEDDPVVGGLTSIRAVFVGALGTSEDSRLTMEPLVESTADSLLTPRGRVENAFDPSSLSEGFEPDEAQHVVAARFRGPVTTAYPDREEEGHRMESDGEVRLIVVADSDLLADYLWIEEQRLGGMSLGARISADNGNFVLNAVDVLGGSDALAAIRGGRTFSRPFEVVDELEREADAASRKREQELEAEIGAAEQRIQELQREKGAGQDALILSPEQTAELDRLEQEAIAARKELRQLRHELNQDIEALGTRLMLLNTVLWPAVVAGLAVFWFLRRARRSAQKFVPGGTS